MLGGAWRLVATAVVTNPLVADSSSKESSCGDSREILRCTKKEKFKLPGNFAILNFFPYLVAPGARRCWAVPGGLW